MGRWNNHFKANTHSRIRFFCYMRNKFSIFNFAIFNQFPMFQFLIFKGTVSFVFENFLLKIH